MPLSTTRCYPSAPTRLLLCSVAASLSLLLAGCGEQQQKTGPHADARGDLRYGALTFKPCALGAVGAEAVEAQCATLSVPENYDAPNGRKIDLAIALVPAKGEAEADPVVMIAGGPGQSALESYPLLHAAFSDVRRNRHVLLVDARGTGKSHPLKCKGFSEAAEDADSNDTNLDAMRALTVRCRDELVKSSDLHFYGTADHIRDLDEVRNTLGIAQLNLIGISYGTRVAQQYAKRYPAQVRSVVLDSVAPNTLVLGQDHARNLESALQIQFARCVKDAACKKNLGDPAAELKLVRERLRAGGLAPVRYRDPVNGEWRVEAPSYGNLALLLRMYAYQPEAATLLPLLVHQAAQGDYSGLMAQSRMVYGSVSDSMAEGMSLSVSCSEDTELKVNPADANTVMGSDFIDGMLAQCSVWPKGKRDADFRTPLSGNLPVLVLSGEYDPVTPPRYGEEVLKTLPNGSHLVFPGQGHNVIGVGCMPKLFAQFLESANTKTLDAACLQRLQPRPPFAGNYGWEP